MSEEEINLKEVFTKDLRFKEAFENQGIRVITYPGNGSPNLRESKTDQVE